MTKSKYVKVTNVEARGSFIQKTSEIQDVIDGELDDLTYPVTLKFEAVEMTDEEYAALPDFAGY